MRCARSVAAPAARRNVRRLIGSLLILVSVPRLSGRTTASPAHSASEWNPAFPDCVFTAPGGYLLRHQGVRSLNHGRHGVVIAFPAPHAAISDRDSHRLIRVHDKDAHQLHAIRGGDAVVTACLGIEHAVGVAAHRIVEGNVIFMLAYTLLAAVLCEDVLRIQVAPVAIAAHQSHRTAVWVHGHADLALTEKSIPGLIEEPGDLRHVNLGRLLGLDYTVLDLGLELRILVGLEDAIGIVDTDITSRVLHDLVRRIADLQCRVVVVHRILISRDPDDNGVEALEHLVV